MLPSDSLSNMVSLLSLVTDTRQDVSSTCIQVLKHVTGQRILNKLGFVTVDVKMTQRETGIFI